MNFGVWIPNCLSFAKTLSGSLRTIRIRGRQPRAEPETRRPASSHRRPCTEAADSRWMSESRQAMLDRSPSRTFSSTEDRGR
jgi:hypothetical protein